MKKKGLMSFILVTLLLGSVGVQPAFADLSDVPRDHWAYHAVVTLVNKGYLAVYEDGTFQGSRPVDRYTLAVTVARILDDIEAGRVQGTVDDLSLIEELTTELRAELVAWYAERAALEEKLSSTEQLLVVTDDRLNRVVSSHTELQEEVASIKAELLEQLRQEALQLELASAEHGETIGAQQALIARQGERIDEQAQQITAHELKINEHAAQLQEYQARLEELVNALVEIEGAILAQDADISSLQNWAGEKSAVLAALQHQDTQLGAETQRLSVRIDELSESTDSRLESLAGSITAVDQSSAATLAQVQETQARVTALTERSTELEKDLQNLAVLIQRETQRRNELSTELDAIKSEMSSLETQIGLSEEELAELRSQISSEVRLEMNAALIREQRLERQIAELEAEFTSYRETSEAQLKSSKTMATIALVVGAIGIVVGFMTGGN
ncbi:MAG TPA: hypothetical protein GX008_02330 [Firmicutes bacterium]|jgi:chromosome segregation ATPase|nr:hypothetical protein [Bacillota bacterium]